MTLQPHDHPEPLVSREVDLRALGEAGTVKLLESLYPAHCRIFASDDWDEFWPHILNPAADLAWLLVFETRAGPLVRAEVMMSRPANLGSYFLNLSQIQKTWFYFFRIFSV